MAPRKPRLGNIPDLNKPMKVRESLTEEHRRRALGEKLEAPAVPPEEAFEPVGSPSSAASPAPASPPVREQTPAAPEPARPLAETPRAAESAPPAVRTAREEIVEEVRMETAARSLPPATEPKAAEPSPAPRPYAPRPTTPPSEARWDRPEAAPEPAPEPSRAAPSPAPSPAGAPARAPEPAAREDEEAYEDAGDAEGDERSPGANPRAFERRRAFSLDGDPYDSGRYRIKIFDLVKEDFQGKERPVKFTVLDNAWDLMSEEQTPGEQAVYIKLYRMSYGFGNRTCVVSVLDIARKMNIARNTARTYLRGLEDKGHIRELYPEFKNRGKVYWVEFPREYLAKKAQAEGRDRAAKAFETSMAKLKEMGIL